MPDAPAPLFRNAAFRRIWKIGLLCGVVRWLEMLAFGIFAFDLTGSPSLVALLVILRFLPLAALGLVMGALSDLVGPRRLMIFGLAGVAATSAAMFAVFVWGAPAYWHVAVATLASGVFWAGDLPVRRRMMADAVPTPSLAAAMALDGAASNGTRMVGPLLGGALYGALGIEGAFALGAVAYLAAIAVTLRLAPDAARTAGGPAGLARLTEPLAGIAEAARLALGDPDARRILAVTVVFNIWGFPYLAMIPVIGRETLQLSAGALGGITALEGAFAMLGALALSRARRPARFRPIYFGAAAGLLATILVMGLATGFWTLAVGLSIGGLCAAGFSAMQTTLIYLVAPPEMRGRFLGLMTLCIGAGVIGFANVGLTAELFGAADALWIIALQGMIPLAAIGWRWRALRAWRV